MPGAHTTKPPPPTTTTKPHSKPKGRKIRSSSGCHTHTTTVVLLFHGCPTRSVSVTNGVYCICPELFHTDEPHGLRSCVVFHCPYVPSLHVGPLWADTASPQIYRIISGSYYCRLEFFAASAGPKLSLLLPQPLKCCYSPFSLFGCYFVLSVFSHCPSLPPRETQLTCVPNSSILAIPSQNLNLFQHAGWGGANTHGGLSRVSGDFPVYLSSPEQGVELTGASEQFPEEEGAAGAPVLHT